ncbi:MAG: ATP phosphoribosyltransferase [Phototrophicaceae bacterium]
MTPKFTLAMPSKGAIYQPTRDFLKECGLKIRKPNERQYIGTMPTIPEMGVLFQRVVDVVYKVADGTAQIGITGYDLVYEHPHEDIIIIYDKLGYGWCKLVVAIPEAWVDVTNMIDLVEVALDFREQKGRNIRIATKYEHSTREFLHRHGIHHFTLVKAEGAIEAAPTLGYADIIVDLTATGTTLRENHLKEIKGGTIVEAEACIIGNRKALEADPELLDAVRVMTEYIDASLKGREYFQVTVDIQGESAEDVARKVASHPVTRGLLGPTVAPIYHVNGNENNMAWFTATLVVEQKALLSAVEHIRDVGGRHVIATPIRYVFLEQAPTFVTLLKQLDI